MTELKTVREAREQHQPPITQEQLAERSGVDQTYISLIERLLRCPSDDVKTRLATALDVAPSSLRFAEPLPGASVDKSYDRAGQSVRPTPRKKTDRRADERRDDDRRDTERRDRERRDRDRREGRS